MKMPGSAEQSSVIQHLVIIKKQVLEKLKSTIEDSSCGRLYRSVHENMQAYLYYIVNDILNYNEWCTAIRDAIDTSE